MAFVQYVSSDTHVLDANKLFAKVETIVVQGTCSIMNVLKLQVFVRK